MNRRLLQQRVNPIAHPSLCNGNPYSQDLRQLVMFVSNYLEQNDNNNVRNFVSMLRNEHVYPCSVTQNRWERLSIELGHVRPCRRTGNRGTQKMAGQDLVYLSIYRVIYPKCSIAEINAFLYNANMMNPFFSFYSPSQISRAESLIGLSKKKGSTTAYQAFYDVNLEKRWNYWNLPYPLGIADIHRSRVIDLDECGVFLETTANRKYGKAYSDLRVRDEGPYSKTEKWNLLLAISGEDRNDGNDARRWADIWLVGGTTIFKMLEFMHVILQDIGHANDQNFVVFTMDNLNSHKNPAVIALIHAYGHGVVFRAPYWAVDGSIEFVFNTIQTLVRSRLYEIYTGEDLVQVVYQTIQSIETFAPYFEHVGFNN